MTILRRLLALFTQSLWLDRCIPAGVSLSGLVLLIGLLRDRPLVGQFRSDWPLVAIPTAVLFIVTGGVLHTYCRRNVALRQSAAVLLLTAVMLSTLWSLFLPYSGRPNPSTIIAFWFVGLGALVNIPVKQHVSGIVGAWAVVCLVGLIAGLDVLYWNWSGIMQGVAMPTALLFLATARYLFVTCRET